MRDCLRTLAICFGMLLMLATPRVFGQEPPTGVKINRKSLRDFENSVKQKLANKEVDLSSPFSVEFEGVLTKEGKFDPQNSQFVRSEGDEKIVAVVKDALSAFGDSGWLIYLRDLSSEKINIVVAQDDSQFRATVTSIQPSTSRANTVVSALNGFLTIALLMDKQGTKKLGDDERKLISGWKVIRDDKNVIINLTIPKSDFQEMIQRKIKESEEKNKSE